MENNKTVEQFCKIHTEYHGEVIDSVKQIVQQTFTGKELMEFCEFYFTQQSKEKDERIKELEFANEEVRKKHDLARNVITDQDEEIKRLREVLQNLPQILHDSLGDRECEYSIKDLPGDSAVDDGEFWITHTEVGSGEPLKQWIKSEIDKALNE